MPQADAQEIVSLIDEAISGVRQMANGLYPSELDSSDLASALAGLVSHTEDRYKASCTLMCDPDTEISDPEATLQLFRISQEAVNNSVRHSKAERLRITLSCLGGMIVLAIQDNGIGLPKGAEDTGGMGLP